jgi:hypothetical protein
MTVETTFNKKFLWGPGAVFSKRAPGRRRQNDWELGFIFKVQTMVSDLALVAHRVDGFA